MSEEFFDRFSWAVPKAFSDAVRDCRFEEGDILYDSKKAYDGDWEKAEKHITHSIQVHSPARGSTTKSSGSIFKRNWNTAVVFQLNSAQSEKTSRHIETTQGKLYTVLWRGDISVFDDDSSPELPLRLKEISKLLEQAIPTAKQLSDTKPIFVMARDSAKNVSRLKDMKVASTLHARFKAEPKVLTPEKAGLHGWERMAPTVDIAFYVMESGSYDEIHAALKDQLHEPAKNAKKDMFRLNTHGLLMAD